VITYTLRRSTRARALRMEVRAEGVVVIAPQHTALRVIENFASRHASWAHRAQKRFEGRHIIRAHRADIVPAKARARGIARELCARYGAFFGARAGSITIRAQKRRWGSCSHRGNLSFNYKIALLPPHLAEYIVVHEMCHLREFNHGKRFWELVARACPDHRDRRNQLQHTTIVFQ